MQDAAVEYEGLI